MTTLRVGPAFSPFGDAITEGPAPEANDAPPAPSNDTSAALAAREPATAQQRKLARAAEYRGRALEATALAEASPLDHVREKHELSAARWNALAAQDEQPDNVRMIRAPAA